MVVGTITVLVKETPPAAHAAPPIELMNSSSAAETPKSAAPCVIGIRMAVDREETVTGEATHEPSPLAVCVNDVKAVKTLKAIGDV